MTDLPRRRVFLILVVFSVLLGAIGANLVSYQVLRGASLGETARVERSWDRPVPARRGTIFDSTGQVLASTVPSDHLEIDLSQVAEADDAELAQALAGPLGARPQELLTQLKEGRQRKAVQIRVKRFLTPAQSAGVRALRPPCKPDAVCVYLTPEPRRVYPNGDFASQVIGYANWEMDGTYGVEQAYNREIGGKPGHARAEVDVNNRVIAVGQNQLDPPVDGSDVTLTIDAAVQRHVEQQLEAAVRKENASGGTAIVMDARTGAIIALANRPSFDPNGFEQFDIGLFSNPAVTQLYEPGSTFKVLTMAIGLETGAVTPNTIFYDSPGYMLIDKHRIANANDVSYGQETMSQVLQHSSNLGSAFVARQTGADAFYGKLREFGIGQGTGIDLPGEEQGLVNWPDAPDWRPINLTTNAFGQGISITPIQMVTAVGAVVNGGKLMRPYVVKEVRQDGRVVRQVEPQVVRQVISPRVSRQVTGMMTEVVDNVSYQYVGVPGYAVGSKSGTAQIPARDGGYEGGNVTIGSMIGVGPAEDPRFVVYVKIDRPKKDPWGSHIAGPPTSQILQHLFTLYSIAPTRKEGRP